jgi:RNA polymerase sigma factor (sigma-70 family)
MDDREFERLYGEHAAGLLSFLIYRTRDTALAEDILADAFERAMRKRVRFDRRKASEKTWLYSIALNLLRDHARRAGAERRALAKVVPEIHGGHMDDAVADVEQRDALERAVGALPEADRDVIALRYGGDLSIGEIAKLTGERHATVESRLYRALRKLRAALE